MNILYSQKYLQIFIYISDNETDNTDDQNVTNTSKNQTVNEAHKYEQEKPVGSGKKKKTNEGKNTSYS